MVVAHNLLAANTNRQLGIVTGNKKKSTERLASGYRINRSADDAAGLSISEKMRWQVRGLNKASNNIQDGISFVQVADGALNEVDGILQRMNELAVQGANDSNTDVDRQAIQQEIDALKKETERIFTDTEFNTVPVFARKLDYKVYTDSSQTTQIGSGTEYVSGNNYGLKMLLGPGKITDASNLADQVTFGNYDDYVTTGEALVYTKKSVTHTYDATGTQTDTNQLAKTTVTSDKSLLPRLDIMNRTNTGEYYYTNSTGINWYKRDGNTLKQTIVDSNGNRQVEVLEIEQIGGKEYITSQNIKKYQTISGKECLISSEELTIGSKANYGNGGSSGGWHFVEGSSYACAYMDFSELGTKYSKNDLLGLGFTSMCMHNCGCYYSIEFVNGFSGATGTVKQTDNNMNYMLKEGSSLLIQLDISSITNDRSGAEKLVAGIVDAADDARFGWGPFDGHREQYAYAKANPTVLYLYENGRDDAQGSASTWEPASRTENGQRKPLNHSADMGRKQYKEDTDLHIQASARGHEAIVIERPTMSNSELEIDGIRISDYANAGLAITKVNRALEYVNSKRSYLGAMQNRLEYAMRNDDNTAENTDAAESRIRDTDMAEEMVNFSKHNILEQAGQSMLAQANQSTQGILSLIQ